MNHKLITIPNTLLKQPAHKVTDFGPELQELLDDMIRIMRSESGVGLAAPQVAVPLKAIVVEFGSEDDENVPPKLYAVVNPTVTGSSLAMVDGIETCLSIPGFAGSVKRSVLIKIKGFSRHGQPLRIKARGWLARIFMHEIDHLNGILYTDRAEKVWEIADDES